MIFTLNHHTSYSYNKFTCRPGYILGSKTPLEPHGVLNSASASLNQKEFKQPQWTIFAHLKLPNATIKTCGQTWRMSEKFKRQRVEEKIQLAYEGRQRFKGQKIAHKNYFFKARPLLCWHNDLAYYNLRLYFLNTLKALHLCWSAARNNKKIAFVGVSGDLLNQASSTCLTSWFKMKSLKRDDIPKIKPDNVDLAFKGAHMSNLDGTSKKRPSGLIKRKSRKFMSSNHKKTSIFHKYARWINTFEQNVQGCKTDGMQSHAPSSAHKNIKTYVLMTKLMKAYEKSACLFLGQNNVRRLANPGQAVRAASSHLLCLRNQDLQKRLQSNWCQLAHRLGQLGLKAPVYNFDLNYTPAESYFESKSNIKSNLKNYEAFFNLRIRRQASYTDQKLVSYAARVQTRIINFLFSRYAVFDTSKRKYKQNQKSYCALLQKKFRGAFYLNYRNKTRIRRGQFVLRSNLRHTRRTFKPHLSYMPRYNKMLKRIEFYDKSKFATNTNLMQADVLFFVHPDKISNMVRMAKNLHIPTIGIVSGLKSKHKPHLKHSYMSDDVNYPIVGNPDNNFFVLLMLRTFMRVINKANTR